MRYFYLTTAALALTLLPYSLYLNFVDTSYGGSNRSRSLSIERGQALYEKHNCQACHGDTGARPIASNYPRINNQPKAYTFRQIRDILSGERSNGASSLMKAAVPALSEDDTAAIAEFLESIK